MNGATAPDGATGAISADPGATTAGAAARRWPRHLLAAGIFLALSTLYLRPIWRVFSTHLAPGLGDPLFNLYILKWGAHQIALGLPDLWNAPFFHPTHAVLAFSDHLLGPAAQLWLLTRLGLNAIAGYNALLLGAFALTGFAAYWLCAASGARFWAALFGGMVYAFCSFRWEQSGHLQVILAGWIPFLLWSWDRCLVELTVRRAAIFVGLYALHVSGGTYLAYMVHVPLVVLAANRWREVAASLRRRPARRLLGFGAVGVACGAMAAWFFLPYARVAAEYGLRRGVDEYRAFGATIGSFLSPSFWNWYWEPAIERFVRQENALFLGLLPSGFAAAEILHRWRAWRAASRPVGGTMRSVLLACLFAAAVGFLLGELRTAFGFSAVELAFDSTGYLLPGVLFVGGLGAWALVQWRHGGGALAPALYTTPWERGLLAVGAVTLALCFPIVFLPAVHLLPGLGGMRVAARFFAFASLPLAWLAARGAERWLPRLADRRLGVAIALLLGLTAIELAPRRLYWYELADEPGFSAADRWLAAQRDVRAVADLPFAPEARSDDEAERMYWATIHWRPIVNGYSGYYAPSYLALRQAIPLLPGRAGVAALRELGVTHVILRLGELRRPPRRARALAAWLASIGQPDGPELEQAFADRRHLVFRILPAAAPAPHRP